MEQLITYIRWYNIIFMGFKGYKFTIIIDHSGSGSRVLA